MQETIQSTYYNTFIIAGRTGGSALYEKNGKSLQLLTIAVSSCSASVDMFKYVAVKGVKVNDVPF